MKKKTSVDWRLCVIVDADAAGGRRLLSLVEEVSRAGATMVQLRAKNLETHDFLEIALKAARLLRPQHIPFIINDRIDIAVASQADGVHLGQEDLALPYARKIVGREFLVGISVNTVEEALDAEKGGADYIGVGPVFLSPSKKDLKPVLGLSGLQAIREKVRIPVLAIGGINAANAGEVMASGADGVAVISAVLGARDVGKATKELLSIVSGYRSG